MTLSPALAPARQRLKEVNAERECRCTAAVERVSELHRRPRRDQTHYSSGTRLEILAPRATGLTRVSRKRGPVSASAPGSPPGFMATVTRFGHATHDKRSNPPSATPLRALTSGPRIGLARNRTHTLLTARVIIKDRLSCMSISMGDDTSRRRETPARHTQKQIRFVGWITKRVAARRR
jgi:hypothetical protein